jgi:ribonuclease HII
MPAALAARIDDSKKLPRATREALYDPIRDHVEIGIGIADIAEIDRLNILQATLLAMRRAVTALPSAPAYALVDGNIPPVLPCPVRTVVTGDSLCLSIAAASIVAKVVRDRLMVQVGAAHPGYGFERHMGYSVPEHARALTLLGPTIHHRRSFAPVAAAYGDAASEIDGGDSKQVD